MTPHKCPVCNGTGLVSRPPGVAGDVTEWVSNGATHPCRACGGLGIIWEPTVETVTVADGMKRIVKAVLEKENKK